MLLVLGSSRQLVVRSLLRKNCTSVASVFNEKDFLKYLISSALTSLTAIDYSEFVREYTNHSNIQTCTNTYTLYTNGVTSLGAMKDISAGEEISRYYGLHFWLHHHLNHLLSTGDKGVYDPKHPLVGTILGLKDPSSVECFSKIRTHFNIWD